MALTAYMDEEEKGAAHEKAMEDVLAHVMEETLLHGKPQVTVLYLALTVLYRV